MSFLFLSFLACCIRRRRPQRLEMARRSLSLLFWLASGLGMSRFKVFQVWGLETPRSCIEWQNMTVQCQHVTSRQSGQSSSSIGGSRIHTVWGVGDLEDLNLCARACFRHSPRRSRHSKHEPGRISESANNSALVMLGSPNKQITITTT